jgi:hypothetical protein
VDCGLLAFALSIVVFNVCHPVEYDWMYLSALCLAHIQHLIVLAQPLFISTLDLDIEVLELIVTIEYPDDEF